MPTIFLKISNVKQNQKILFSYIYIFLKLKIIKFNLRNIKNSFIFLSTINIEMYIYRNN